MLANFKENILIISMLLNSREIEYLLSNNVSKITFIYVHLLQSLYRPTWISLYLQFASVHTPFHLFCTHKKKKRERKIYLALTYITPINISIMMKHFNLVWIKKLKSQAAFLHKLHFDMKSKFSFNKNLTVPKQKLIYKKNLVNIHFSLKTDIISVDECKHRILEDTSSEIPRYCLLL